MALVVKNLPANAGDIRDTNSISWLWRSPGGEHGSPIWYSCLENPLDRGRWWATVHRIAQSQTWLSTAQKSTSLNSKLSTCSIEETTCSFSLFSSLFFHFSAPFYKSKKSGSFVLHMYYFSVHYSFSAHYYMPLSFVHIKSWGCKTIYIILYLGFKGFPR